MLCDLHLHTTKSDGVWSPERLFEEIRARDLQYFSITDHDCLDAYPVPEDLRARCIPGLEVDSHHGGHTVHILAYGIEDKDCELLEALRDQRERRIGRMVAMVERIRALDIDITIGDVRAQVSGASSLGRPHLARALVAKGAVSTVQEAFDRYLADEGGGFVALERMTSAQIIPMIHRCGGLAVIAHPMRLRNPAHLEELCELGADGIEVIHPTASAADEHMLRSFSQAQNLLKTGGSDFHAPESSREIGAAIEESDLQQFLERLHIAVV